MSCQRILAQANNAATSASVSASSVLPAARQIFQQQTTREGNGAVVLSGDYEGAADATFDVEIRAPSTGAELATTPVFSGAGNGTLEDLSVDPGTAAQDITVTLVDLGTETSAAQLTIYGDILLRAKTAGSGGNALVLTVTPNLTLSASAVGALSTALEKDTQDWTDQRGDFGAVPLLPDGTIPTTAPRLVFGGDLSRVYRHYKRWDGDQWRYGVSPKLAAAYPEGSTVHTVTGDYSVTVTDGVTPETYASITTLYSLTVALAASLLVEVVGAVGNNAKPNGIAAIDLPIRTSAFALPIISSDPDRMPGLTDVSVAASSPTETITLECTKNSPVGAETWAVRSKAAGTALADAITNVLYGGSDALAFRIPKIPRTTSPVDGVIAITDQNYPRGDDDGGAPAVCLYKPVLGAKASSKTLKLVWTKRPPADCDCNDASVVGNPSSKCLGIDIEGEVDMGVLVAGYQSRLETLYGQRANFISANTAISATTGALTTAFFDVELYDLITQAFRDCLDDLFEDSDTPDSGALAQWDSDLNAMNSALAQLAALGTSASVTTRYRVGATYSGGDQFLPPDGQDTGHYYQIYLPMVAYDEHIEGTPLYYQPYSFVGHTDVAWPTNGGRAEVSGMGEIYYGDSPYPSVPVTAYIIDLGPYDDADVVTTGDPAALRHAVDQFVRRYSAKMDYIRAQAGILPKSSAGSEGDGCWRDQDTDFWWVIVGTAYLPVFNNLYYHSAVLAPNEDGKLVPTSTNEFGFGLQVACDDRLKEGDSITISIDGVSADYPYQIGDTYQIPIVGGGPLSFAGGVDGSDTLTWAVQASVDGALADYALDLDEDPYAAGGLNFAIHRGGIPFALGDQFAFSIEAGGRLRWRKDAGSWSSDTAIADTVSLTDGLSALFQSGAAPSFVAGDVYSYSVRQPNAPDHTQSAHEETWRWSGAAAYLALEWTSDQTIECVGLLRHGLSSPATVSIALKNGVGTTLQTLAPTVADGPILVLLPAALTTVRSIEITVVNAGGMALGWVYAGVPFEPSHNARVTLRRAYALDRSSGLNPRGAYLGAGRGGEIAWENWLLQDEFNGLLSLIDDCKGDDDAPIVFLPQADHPSDAALARIDSDALEVSDVFEFQPGDASRRRLSLTLPLAAVLA
jgi:hypothetical protein